MRRYLTDNLRKAARAESQRRYRRSLKYKAVRKRYNRSVKGKAALKRCSQTYQLRYGSKIKERRRKYHASPRGQSVRRAYNSRPGYRERQRENYRMRNPVSESKFWGIVKKMLDGMTKYRIENRVASGIPDVYTAYRCRERWIELKVFKGNQITVRFSQVKWLMLQQRQGLDNTVIVALHKDHIKGWRGSTLLSALMSNTKKRESQVSFHFVPPEPADFIMSVGAPDDVFRDFLFE